MRILIVSTYYWPEIAGNAPYVTDVAEYLAEDHEVTVLAGFPHYPAWRRVPLADSVPTHGLRGVTVRRHWHPVPSAHTAASRAIYESSLAVTGMLGYLATRTRPDVVLGFCPALADVVVASCVARLVRRPFGVVFQDLISRAVVQSGVGGGRWITRAVRATEARLARRATAVGFAAPGFRSHLESVGVSPERLVLLRNWTLQQPALAARDETRSRLGWAPDDFVCLHAGNMGQKQGLENLIAAARLSNGRTRFVLAGDGNERARLEALAAGVRNLTFLDSQPPGAYEAMLDAADVLMVNQRAAVTDMALASKLTSYFAAAKPVIAAVAAASETAREIERARGGILVKPEQPGELAQAVGRLRREPERAVQFGENAKRYAQTTLDRSEGLRAYGRFVDRIAAAHTGRFAQCEGGLGLPS